MGASYKGHVMKFKKQTASAYTIELEGKVVGWITKELNTLYKIKVKTLLGYDEDFIVGFSEAKKKAVELLEYWKD